MTHELIWTVLDAQRTNATLSGHDLRAAAEDLTHIHTDNRTILKAFDAAGERIIGAAMALSDKLESYDHTGSFPQDATCLLVGGTIVGPVGVAAAARTVTDAGAQRVEVAFLGGRTDAIPGVARVRVIGATKAHVA